MNTSKGASLDKGEQAHEVTVDAQEELMMEKTTVLGVLSAQLQALQVRPLGVMTPHLVGGATKDEQMVHAHIAHTLVLSKGAILVEAEGDIKG